MTNYFHRHLFIVIAGLVPLLSGLNSDELFESAGSYQVAARRGRQER